VKVAVPYPAALRLSSQRRARPQSTCHTHRDTHAPGKRLLLPHHLH
jgi:hypothetical protein